MKFSRACYFRYIRDLKNSRKLHARENFMQRTVYAAKLSCIDQRPDRPDYRPCSRVFTAVLKVTSIESNVRLSGYWY